jgi:hypothetical protein
MAVKRRAQPKRKRTPKGSNRTTPAPRELVELSLADFEARFPLVPNPFDDAEPIWQNADDEGCFFDTVREHVEFVAARDPLEIWTVMDDDTLQSGYHVANRIGFLVSSVKRRPTESFVVHLR